MAKADGSDVALAFSFAKRPSVATTFVPEQELDTPIAQIPKHPLLILESALKEARSKRPGMKEYLISLSGPAGLLGKSAYDLSHALEKNPIETVPFLLAVLFCSVGLTTFIATLLSLLSAGKKSELQRLAHQTINDSLLSIGERPTEKL